MAWGISGQFWSAVPAVSTPRFLPTPSPVAEEGREQQTAWTLSENSSALGKTLVHFGHQSKQHHMDRCEEN